MKEKWKFLRIWNFAKDIKIFGRKIAELPFLQEKLWQPFLSIEPFI